MEKQEYINRTIIQLQDHTIGILTLVTPFLLFVIGVMSYFYGPIPGTRIWFAMTYIGTALCMVVTHDLCRFKPNVLRNVQVGLLLIPIASHVWAFEILFAPGSNIALLFPAADHMALSILLIIYAHGEIKPTLTMIGLSIAPVLWGLLAAGEFQAETFGCFLIISGEIIAVGWVGVSVLRNNCMVSEKEMERLSLLAPAHIVRKMDNLTDLKQAFAPKSRPCVFISSDWRGYQELSGQLDMAQLATSLGYYYDLCEEVLGKYFPEGNYFTDWIADELFIVMFSSPSQSLDEVIRSSLQFCTELIERKQVFYQKYGFPEAIDIGVSSGEAYAGMLGPKSSPKATALGEVPGRSRRLQTVGKVLRQKFGETDRVIFGQEVFKELNPADYVVEELDVSQGDIRDVDDRKIYFVGSRNAKLKVAS